MVLGIPEIAPPPSGGSCSNNVQFVTPTSEAEKERCISICHTCPIFDECSSWAQQAIEADNVGLNPRHGRRVPLQGVIAGTMYHATDYQGSKLDLLKHPSLVQS